MRIAGLIIGILGVIVGLIAALVVLLIGVFGSALDAEGSGKIIGLSLLALLVYGASVVGIALSVANPRLGLGLMVGPSFIFAVIFTILVEWQFFIPAGLLAVGAFLMFLHNTQDKVAK